MNGSWDCPVCGGSAALNVSFIDGRYKINCFRCPEVKGEYLRALADALGLPPGSASALLSDPPRYLGPPAKAGPRSGWTELLPSEARIAAWAARLERSERPYHYLARDRGLSAETARRYELGWDGAAITIPVRDASSRLINLRRRQLEPGAKPKIRGLGGRGTQIYPAPPSSGRLLLCAGEFDALIARQHGLAAVTTTCGATLPDALVPHLRPAGRRITVAYDVGEEAKAELTAAKLKAAGARVRVAVLPLAATGADLTDWFVKEGRTVEELREVLRWRRAVTR